MVAHTSISRTPGAEAGASRVQVCPRLYSETLSEHKQTNKQKICGDIGGIFKMLKLL
jgi:hypothetical protein